jgi:hypothetical protein
VRFFRFVASLRVLEAAVNHPAPTLDASVGDPLPRCDRRVQITYLVTWILKDHGQVETRLYNRICGDS